MRSDRQRLLTTFCLAAAIVTAVDTQTRVPAIWDDAALADWATPIAALQVRPRHYKAADYYAVPAQNLRTYPVYLPDREPSGYWESLQKKKPEPLVDLIARRFRVIGEPMRIRLLDRLREGEASVNELTEALAASQQNVSKHLAVLLEAGIVGRRKQGNRVLYAIADESIFALCEQVCGSLQRQLAELNALVEGMAP